MLRRRGSFAGRKPQFVVALVARRSKLASTLSLASLDDWYIRCPLAVGELES